MDSSGSSIEDGSLRGGGAGGKRAGRPDKKNYTNSSDGIP